MTGNDKTKLQQWAQHLKDWESSGVTQRAYCEREGLKYSTFDYWRRQIRATGAAVKLTSKRVATKRLTLVPVRLSDKRSADSIVLRTSRWQLELPGTVDTAWLASLLRELA
jgi:hypothetical protein